MDGIKKEKKKVREKDFSVNRAKNMREEYEGPRLSSCGKRKKRQCSFKNIWKC